MPRRPSAPLPDFIAPQLAQLVDRPQEGDAWLHEIKLDGYRTLARIERGQACMLTRHVNDWTSASARTAGLFSDLKARSAYLDGDRRADPEGVSDFGAILSAVA